MCSIFWGSFWEGEGYVDKIFYEAVKIPLNLVEKDYIIHFKTDTINAKVLDFHTYLEFRTFVLHKCFFLKKATTYVFQSLEMTSKAQKVTFLPVWLEQ